MIPKIIHQVWIGKKYKKPTRLMETWKAMNPSCECVEWNDDSLAKEDFGLRPQISAMKSLHGKVTLMRYELLYKYGGFIVDADSECILPLDEFFFENERFTCYENEVAGIYRGVTRLSAGYMGAKKNDVFMGLCVLELMTRKVNRFKSHCIAGNLFFAVMVNRFKTLYPMKIYPSHYFIPKHGTGVEYTGSGPIYAKQYWGSTFGIYNKL